MSEARVPSIQLRVTRSVTRPPHILSIDFADVVTHATKIDLKLTDISMEDVAMNIRRTAFLCAIALLAPTLSIAADSTSTYSEVASDIVVGSSDISAVSTTISLPSAAWVYVQTDGRVWPSGGQAVPAIHITADGNGISNTSIVDWSVSLSPQQHSYNAIGAVFLQAGTHTIALHAQSLNATSFTLGARSNLSVVVNPATTVTSNELSGDTGVLSYNVNGLNAQSVLPTQAQITANVNGNAGSTLVALSSARIYRWGNAGDPLTTIGMDGSTLPNNQANWSDNDMYEYAENQAPFFTHAFVTGLSGAHSFSLLTTALPYSGDQVQYRMGGDSRLVTLQGGMTVLGAASLASDANNVGNYICIATSSGWTGCPPVGTAVALAQADIVIPASHNGVVFITGKTRLQADSSDQGGVGNLFLTVDGITRGSLGIQQLASPDSVSTRTLATSYLAAGSLALSPGTHHVVLYAQATGSFIHLAMTKDLPLLWFD